MRIPILLLAGICFGAHAAEPTRIGMRTTIEVGPSFEVDPYSAEEGKKWTASGKDPSTGIELWICAYGYVSEMDLLHTIPDFNYEDFRLNPGPAEELIKKNARCKTVGEYFSKKVIPKGATKTRLDWSDRYEHWEEHRVTVWFYKRSFEDDLYGWCYEQMQIDTGETSAEDLKGKIRRLIDSARPWDVPWKNKQEQPSSEQD